MDNSPIMLITGTRKGIGRNLAEYYIQKKFQVIGCSRQESDFRHENYQHYCLDISDEPRVIQMFGEIRHLHNRLDILINNAGIASMNHMLLTPMNAIRRIYDTNVIGAFLFCREAAKLMQKNRFGRIINFTTVATALKLDGEAAYASSKAAIVSLTGIMAKELGDYGITVNAIGPTPIQTDLIRAIPQTRLDALLNRQAVKRFGEYHDITNVIDFFIAHESDFITGQTIYLGGIS